MIYNNIGTEHERQFIGEKQLMVLNSEIMFQLTIMMNAALDSTEISCNKRRQCWLGLQSFISEVSCYVRFLFWFVVICFMIQGFAVTQDDPELTIIHLQFPWCWNYKLALPHVAQILKLNLFSVGILAVVPGASAMPLGLSERR